MLSIKPRDLWAEIKDAEALRDHYLSAWRDILKRWVGDHYRDDMTGERTLENSIHSFLSIVLPQLVFDDPTADVTSNHHGSADVTSEVMEAAIAHWIRRYQYRRYVLTRMARDLILGWGVTQVGFADANDRGATAYLHDRDTGQGMGMPFSRWVPVGSHFVDAKADGYEQRRIEGSCADRLEAG
jgi:hypothetical protein